MKAKDVIRAWKDLQYRESLSEADRASMPTHPSGTIELTDADLGMVSGGATTVGLNCNTARGPNCPTGIANTLRCCQP